MLKTWMEHLMPDTILKIFISIQDQIDVVLGLGTSLLGLWHMLVKVRGLRTTINPMIEEAYSVKGITASNISNKSCYPVTDFRVTSAYGMRKLRSENSRRMHNGVDLISTSGIMDLYAGIVGRVTYIYDKWIEGDPSHCGNKIIIEVSTKMGLFRIQYWHLSSVAVAVGDVVTPLTHIGAYGNTGYSFGSHLHYQVDKLLKGSWISQDPAKFMQQINRESVV